MAGSSREPRRSADELIRVAVVDDHELVRSGICNALGMSPEIQVVGEAGDGLAALAILESAQVDVLLLDLHMPRMDGFACLDAVTAAVADSAGHRSHRRRRLRRRARCHAPRSGCVRAQVCPPGRSGDVGAAGSRRRRADRGESGWRAPSATPASPLPTAEEPKAGSRAHSKRARGAQPGGAGHEQRRYSPHAVHHDQDGQVPSHRHLRQAGRAQPDGGGRLGYRDGSHVSAGPGRAGVIRRVEPGHGRRDLCRVRSLSAWPSASAWRSPSTRVPDRPADFRRARSRTHLAAVMVVTGVAFVLAFLRLGLAWRLPLAWFFIAVMIVVAFIDWELMIIPNKIVLPAVPRRPGRFDRVGPPPMVGLPGGRGGLPPCSCSSSPSSGPAGWAPATSSSLSSWGPCSAAW